MESCAQRSEPIPAPLRPLFPEVVRQADSLRVCVEIARFLRRMGYWPKAAEITKSLGVGADKAGVVYRLQDLAGHRFVERIARKGSSGEYRLTARGWDLLGVAPYEPWCKRPTRNLIAKAVNAAARRVLEMERSA